MKNLFPVHVIGVASSHDLLVEWSLEYEIFVTLIILEKLFDLPIVEMVLAQLSPNVLFLEKRLHRIIHLTRVH